uniref:Uncharacterized protein n=1 Tax=Glossina brevipalpis TaxID=37001 RepID=A0A1A9VZ83_9MUSC
MNVNQGPLKLAQQNNNLEDNNSDNFNKTFMSTSKLVDPIQLLRSINKGTAKYKTTLETEDHSVKSNRKHYQSLHDKINEENGNSMLKKENTVRSLFPSPYTPLNSKDCTRIAMFQTSESRSGGTRDLTYFKKSFAINKVQNASVNFGDLSISPSGRLDPLVTIDDRKPLLPKMEISYVTMNEPNLSQEAENM